MDQKSRRKKELTQQDPRSQRGASSKSRGYGSVLQTQKRKIPVQSERRQIHVESGEPHYSPAHKAESLRKERILVRHGQAKKEVNSWTKAGFTASLPLYLPLGFISVILSLTFYSFPLLHRQPVDTASQNLYSGFAMNHGLAPYNQFFGSQGPLFYLINQVGNFGGSTFLLWFFELVALFMSGVLAFKIVAGLTRGLRIAFVTAVGVLIAVAGISLGGDSGAAFTLPFALYGIYHLASYLEGGAKLDRADETFILYGVAGAIAILLAPIFVLVWVYGFFALLGNNVMKRQMARGLYQFLATLFGLLLVFAFIGYWTLNTQIFFPALEQAFVIPLTHWNFGSNRLIDLVTGLSLLLIFGLLTSWVMGFRRGTYWSKPLLLFAVIGLMILTFSPSFFANDFLLLLPFVFIFSGLKLEEEAKLENSKMEHLFGIYFRMHLALPIIGLLFLIATPVFISITNHDVFASQRAVATYIKQETQSSDHVFVYGDTKNINLEAGRVSQLDLVPAYYPVALKQEFDVAVSNLTDKYVVVDQRKSLPASLKQALKEKYRLVDFKDAIYSIYVKK